jgi:tRNA A37 threonylcarbamoyladenosine dehydratase
VLAVWSVEEPRETLELPGDEDGIPGTRERPEGSRRRDPRCYGSVAFVTGVFGLAAAGAVVHGVTGVTPRTHRVLDDAEQARRRKRAIPRK